MGRSMMADRRVKHGFATHTKPRPVEYGVWRQMRKRCTSSSCHDWKYYGGKGIRICDRWKSFDNFFADMGERPSPRHTLDRIDSNGHYEPANCRWATPVEQSNNRSCTVFLEHNGERLPIGEWSKRSGVPADTMWHRVKAGWSAEDAIAKPVKGRK